MFEYDEDTRSEELSEGEWYQEAFQQYGNLHGKENQNQEWILTPRDTWVKNPHYIGLPGRHPEDDHDDEDDTSFDWNKARKEADYIPDWM